MLEDNTEVDQETIDAEGAELSELGQEVVRRLVAAQAHDGECAN